MVGHRTAMRISHRKSTLHRLPPHGVRWEWGDVVDAHSDGDGVSKKAVHAVKPLLDKHPDGRYETTQRLETYLQDKHGIELTGRCEDQARLPIDTAPARESTVRTDGSGVDRSGESMQLALDGYDAADAVAERDAREDLEANVAAGKTPTSKSEAAKRDARQATMDAYAGRVRVGPLARRTGDAYESTGTRVSVDA